MKILHLAHNFPPQFRGGTEVYVEALAGLQAEAGHEVLVVAGSDERRWCDDFVEEAHPKVKVLRFHRLPEEDYAVDFYLERFEGLLLDHLQASRPDVLHLHHWFNLSNEILQPAAAAGIPSVLTLHDLYALCPRFFMTRPEGARCGPEPVPTETCLECAKRNYEGTWAQLEGEFRIRVETFKGEIAAAGQVIVPSRSHAEPYLLAGLFRDGGYEVLPHGLVRSVPRPVWKPGGNQPLKLVSWGNIVPAKGIHVLLEALGQVEGAELHLHGNVLEPEYRERLEERSGSLKVFFHGDFSDLEALAEGMDLAVFPSLARESYSMVLDEALALGLPVVVSDAGALPERVGEAGRIVPRGDSKALGRTLAELAGNRALLDPMSEAARNRVWTLNHSRERLDGVYEKVAKEGARRVLNRSRLRRAALHKTWLGQLKHEKALRDGADLRFSRFREFVPLKDFAHLPAGRVLVLAPHPDDEVIGCGGVMGLHAGRGDEVTVLHFTDGSGGGVGENLSKTRKSEARAAGEVLGVHGFLSLDVKDGMLRPDEETVERLADIVRKLNPSVVYAPSAFEIHPDHMAALFTILKVMEGEAPDFALFLYEVNEVMVPGFLIDITPVKEKKDAALACFKSQIPLNDVREKSMAGARWRTANVDLTEVSHAEAFIEAGAGSLRGLMARVKELVMYVVKTGARHG
jgi:LmbE family N-acetylglucosaminyl deacetylase/glycosyltransferase involved in cell wall biosynthesis